MIITLDGRGRGMAGFFAGGGGYGWIKSAQGRRTLISTIFSLSLPPLSLSLCLSYGALHGRDHIFVSEV